MPAARLRALPSAAVVLCAAAVGAGEASAHITVKPAASRPADRQIYTVLVPNERESATTAVRLQIPEGFDAVLVEDVAPWRARLLSRGGRPTEIRWGGGRIAPGGYRSFRFIARNPVREGEVAWKAIQIYADGEDVRWIGAPDAESPAAVTSLSETAAPVDVVSTHGEAAPAVTTPATSASGGARATAGGGDGAADGDGGRDGLTLGLAIAALVAALAGVGVALRGRRVPAVR